MIRSFAWCEDVRMAFLQNEVCTPILQRKPTSSRDYTRTKPTVIAIDEGNSVAEAVGHRKVDRITVVVGWRAMINDI